MNYFLVLILTAHCWFVGADCPPRYLERREHGVDEIPYIVYLEMESKHEVHRQPYHAAGIIIDVNMVLTLALHCETAKSKSMRVYPGQTYVNPKFQEIHVEEYLLHPNRRGKTLDDSGGLANYALNIDYNFCLLRLSKSLAWSATIQKAPLPFSDETIVPNKQYMVSGWGPYENDEYVQGRCNKAYPTNNTRASLFYSHSARATADQCRNSLAQHNIDLTASVFCLGYPCKDYHTAYGDDGGPVVDVASGKVVGMVINLRALDNKKEYQPNAELAYAVNWINEIRRVWVRMAPPVKAAA